LPQLDIVIIYSQVWGIFFIVTLFFVYNLVVSLSDAYELNRGGVKIGRFFIPEHVVSLAFGFTILINFILSVGFYFVEDN